MVTTNNGFILNDPINGHIEAGSEIRPVLETGEVCPIKCLSVKVEGMFRTYVSTAPYAYLKLAYYEFPVPVQGYHGFLATWSSIV